MTRVIWGEVGQRFFETGVDRGVLYVKNSPGVPWDGLVAISEAPVGAEATPSYYDGVKYLNVASSEEFQATIEAYTYPVEFAECDGTAHVSNGLYATQQKRKPFGLAYRSKVGNDVDGVEHAYKLHLVYEALAAPSAHAHSTLGDSVDPDNFSWSVTTRPLPGAGRPTAHFIIDSRETPTELLRYVEDILYGSSTQISRLLSIRELVSIFNAYNSSSFDAGFIGDPYFGGYDAGRLGEPYTAYIDAGRIGNIGGSGNVVLPPVNVYDGGGPVAQTTVIRDGGTPSLSLTTLTDGGVP